MGFTEILTIVFIVLKLLGIIDWAWWLVLLPEIIMVAIYVIICIVHCWLAVSIRKEQKKRFDDMWK